MSGGEDAMGQCGIEELRRRELGLKDSDSE